MSHSKLIELIKKKHLIKHNKTKVINNRITLRK
jgi:hypothetical protein